MLALSFDYADSLIMANRRRLPQSLSRTVSTVSAGFPELTSGNWNSCAVKSIVGRLVTLVMPEVLVVCETSIVSVVERTVSQFVTSMPNTTVIVSVSLQA